MPKIPDSIYNWLKWISVIFIPALVTFLSIVLGALNVEPTTVNTIVTIIAALGTFLGALIGVSTIAYNKDKKAADEQFKANNGMNQ